MAISTDSVIEFYGTQDLVSATSGTAAVSDAAFSGSNDTVTWTNDDDAPMASAVLSVTYATAADANSSIGLYARMLDIDSTNDQDKPDANYPHTFLGAFPLNDVTSAQYIAIDVSLPNTQTSQDYQFYIENNGGQTISAGWTLKITPKTYGPHA